MVRSFTALNTKGEVASSKAFSFLAEADKPLLEVLGLSLLDLPDVEVDEAHGEHVVGQEGELVFAVRVVGLEGIPQERDILLLLRALERERQVVAQFGGFFHGSCLRRGRLLFAPDAGEGGLDLLLEAGDQFAVGGDQRLLGFDLGDDGLLGGEGWEGDLDSSRRTPLNCSCCTVIAWPDPIVDVSQSARDSVYREKSALASSMLDGSAIRS